MKKQAPSRSQDEWNSLLDKQKKSGLSLERWAKENGVAPSSLYHAHCRAKKMGRYASTPKKAAKTKGKFVQYAPVGTELNGHIRIELKSGASIHVANDNVEGLRTVLQALTGANQ